MFNSEAKMVRLQNQVLALLLLCTAIFVMVSCKPKSDKSVQKQLIAKQEIVDFENAFATTYTFDDKAHKLLCRVTLKEGFHAYAPGEKIGKAVELVISKENGWTVQGSPIYPAGEAKNLGELGVTKVLENTFVIEARVSAGKGNISGALNMQLCTATACDRPREHPFEIAVNE